MKAFRHFPFVPVLRLVAGYEVVQVFPAQRIDLQREVFICSEVIDPDLLGPGLLASDLAVEEDERSP
jgi:hypothetical protein